MRVLVVSVSRSTSPTGVCRHAASLCRALVRSEAGLHVTMLAGAWQEHYFRKALGLDQTRVEVVPVNIPNTSPARNWFHLCGVRAHAKRLQPDVVHFAFPVTIWPFLRKRAKVVVSLHDLYAVQAPEAFGKRRAWANYLTTLWGLWAADAIAAVSYSTLGALRTTYPALAAKCSVAPNLVLWDPAPNAGVTTRDTPGFLLCVAQHRAHKRLDLLLETFSLLRCRGALADDVELVIVGEHGPETERLQVKARALLVAGKVSWRRGLPDEELVALYRNALALVAPSRIEGFGLPVAEALAVGCPVVCSRIAAHAEVAGERANYFSANATAEDVADAIQRCLLEERAAPRHPRRCAEELAADYVSLYTSLLLANDTEKRSRQQFRGGPHERAAR